ncbi:SPFH domain-containing protein [Mycoplasma sp. 1654_15]|uniref:SPFH domain-containing protein n=1 Tax=Mycoplasma sp. 1654_15 TaxID=2725994 RepID=UPI001448D39B|nr:SPFH domain-containing protein [Mycoplasma sp. 1654_15]QJB70972.1 SPFH/Band 7/PHB domain protein [Mycoplasma sp. 1654_15]
MSTAGLVILIFFIIILVVLAIILVSRIRIIPQSHFYIVERLGKYHRTIQNGLHFIWPFLERISLKENWKEKVYDFPAQDIITKDNANIKVDSVVFLQITDPKLFAYGAEKPIKAIENLSATTLRNLLGDLELDETLTSRDTINLKLTQILDTASDAWGIKVHRVEIKNIIPPKDIQNAMEKQMRAEREKRANILEAEGSKTAKILEAEAFKQSSILEAEGKKQAAILAAEAEKESQILKAAGTKEAIELLNSSNVKREVLVLKSIEQLGTLANGKATKIIIPPNLSNVASTMATVSELFKEEKSSQNK